MASHTPNTTNLSSIRNTTKKYLGLKVTVIMIIITIITRIFITQATLILQLPAFLKNLRLKCKHEC